MAKIIFSREDLFDLIAPIHLFHQADVCLLKDAQTAFRKLKKVRDHDLVKEYFGSEIDVLLQRNVSNVDSIVFWKIYNRLFEEIVTKYFPAFKSTFDMYGAKCFIVSGYTYLSGDAFDCFPFYISFNTLAERLMNLTEEVA